MIVALSNLGVFIKSKNPFKKDDLCVGAASPTPPRAATIGGSKIVPNSFGLRTAETDLAGSETSSPRQLSVILEDYYQAEAFREVIRPQHWYRFEPRLVRATCEALKLLDQHDVKATFFVSGWIALRFPALVAEVVRKGHEIGLLGEVSQRKGVASLEELRDDILRGRQAVEQTSGKVVVGYRFAQGSFPPADPRILDLLIEEGFQYASGPGSGQKQRHELAGAGLWVIPDPAPEPLYQTVNRSSIAGRGDAAMMSDRINVHTWEFDPDQPRVEALSRAKRSRHYRELGETPVILRECLSIGRFESIAKSLGLSQLEAPVLSNDAGAGQVPLRAPSGPTTNGSPIPVSLVVPCYNEEPTIKYLANTLKNVRESLGSRFDLWLVLVDDGSSDDTWSELRAAFGGWTKVNLVRHERNRGVAASILTGIRHANTEVVCSIDCDCTYDPHEIAEMVPLLTADIDLVTASPYHPQGTVRNVQGARLFLSRSASFLYRRVFRQKLFTYTSCFRVYRKSVMEGMELTYPGFLGVVEILGRLDLRGAKVVEYPTTLEVRVFGHSKMKLVRTILAHLGLLAKLLWTRLGHASALSSGGIPRSSLPDDAIELGYSPQKG
jgi:peptidoglycan/xylan/chitin deacetylase (PgdA/CDA1 family)